MSKNFLAFVLGLMFISVAATSFEGSKDQTANDGTRPVDAVVELFTSQGCPSCAPAAALLKSFDQKSGVLALSWHIAYWDRFGWEDPFAEAEHAMRQSAYNKRLGMSGVYTPQLIYNGREEASGTDQTQAEATLDQAASAKVLTLSPSLSIKGQTLAIKMPQAKGQTWSRAVVKVVYFIEAVTTDIMAGENNGKRIMSNNVVRKEVTLGDWKGQMTTLSVPARPEGADKAITHAAVLVHQDYGHGPMIGAAVIALPK